jgi:hypothetical protein
MPPIPAIPPIMILWGFGTPWSSGEKRVETAPRLPPRASSSSTKMTAPPYLSDIARAFLNMRRTFMLPMPMNMLAKPLPLE